MINPITRAVKTVVPAGTRYTLRTEVHVLRDRGAVYAARWNAALIDSWVRDRLQRGSYHSLTAGDVRAQRRSDRVFIFGSGASLNEITTAEWNAIAEHDTLGFNGFHHQRWIRTDFHLIRGGVYGELRWRPHGYETRDALAANPHYADTTYLLQEDYLGHFANLVVGRRLLPAEAKLFRYRTKPGPGPPSRSLAEGVRHAPGTLSDCVNLAYLLGWKEIILVGVDLYDSRYFWLPPDKTLGYDPATANVIPVEVNPVRGNRYDDPHNTARSGVVSQMGEWYDALAAEGVDLSIWNPRSLLAEVLPLFARPTGTTK